MFPETVFTGLLLIKAGLAALLIISGAAKLAEPRSFATTLLGLGLPAHPSWLTQSLALALPLLEVGIGIGTISGLFALEMSIIMLLLLCSFTCVVLFALSKKRQVTCRCFGALGDSQFSKKGLLRSFLFTVLAFLVFLGNLLSVQSALPGVSEVPLPLLFLLIAGYFFLAIVTLQAARTTALLKKRKISL